MNNLETSVKNSRYPWVWALLYYTLLVILWGAWVRISHSGDGCGDSWPLCEGRVIPTESPAKTWVEFTHRVMSGLYGIFVIILFLWNLRDSSRSPSSFLWARMSLIFMITEALLGAKLVLFGLVGSEDSGFRVLAMSLHQLNSLCLVAFTTLWAFAESDQLKSSASLGKLFRNSPLWVIFLLGLTGAWAALSTTLFPSLSLFDGLMSDLSKDAHFILKIRVLHPILGIFLGLGLALMAWKRFQKSEMSQSLHLCVVTAATVLVGILTLLTLSPLFLKLLHLGMAHGVLIFLLREWVVTAEKLP